MWPWPRCCGTSPSLLRAGLPRWLRVFAPRWYACSLLKRRFQALRIKVCLRRVVPCGISATGCAGRCRSGCAMWIKRQPGLLAGITGGCMGMGCTSPARVLDVPCCLRYCRRLSTSASVFVSRLRESECRRVWMRRGLVS